MPNTSIESTYEQRIKKESASIIYFVSKKIGERHPNVTEIRRRRLHEAISKKLHSRTLFTVFCRFYQIIDYKTFAVFVKAGIRYYEDILYEYKRYVSLDVIYGLFWSYDLEDQFPATILDDCFRSHFDCHENIVKTCHSGCLQAKFIRVTKGTYLDLRMPVSEPPPRKPYRVNEDGTVVGSTFSLEKFNELMSRYSQTYLGVSRGSVVSSFIELAFERHEYKVALDYIVESGHMTYDNISLVPHNIEALEIVEKIGHKYSDKFVICNNINCSPECLEFLLDRYGIKKYEVGIKEYFKRFRRYSPDHLESCKILICRGLYHEGMNNILAADAEFCVRYLHEGMETIDPILGEMLAYRKKMAAYRRYSNVGDILFKFL